MGYDNSGSLWRNEDKTEENPNWADYKGTATIGGVEFYVNAWLKTVEKEGEHKGKKFFSMSFKEKEGQDTYRQPETDDDSVPF